MLVVSMLEWIGLGLVFLGIAVPAWIFSLALYTLSKRSPAGEPSARYFAYMRVIQFLHQEIETGKTRCAPLWVATLRELREYPEYADLSVLYLEEIMVTGQEKFDRVMEQEIKETEAFLLESNND